MLWEGMGFGWAEASFSGVAQPRVNTGLRRAVRLGFRRIIVFPYFLFTGILVKRIYRQSDEVAQEYPEIQFLKAAYLKDHPLVLEVFQDRIGEISTGDNRMNCQLCKYREQVIGYEGEVGAPQAGHHLHVRGVGTGADTGADTGHSHGHHPHDHHHGDGQGSGGGGRAEPGEPGADAAGDG